MILLQFFPLIIIVNSFLVQKSDRHCIMLQCLYLNHKLKFQTLPRHCNRQIWCIFYSDNFILFPDSTLCSTGFFSNRLSSVITYLPWKTIPFRRSTIRRGSLKYSIDVAFFSRMHTPFFVWKSYVKSCVQYKNEHFVLSLVYTYILYFSSISIQKYNFTTTISYPRKIFITKWNYLTEWSDLDFSFVKVN